MLKRNKDLLWISLVLVFFGLFVFGLNRWKQPKKVTIELKENFAHKSDEDLILGQALKDPDALLAEEESSLVLPTAKVIQDVPEVIVQMDEITLEPISEKAPATELSPVLRQSVKNSEVYATEDYLNRDSPLNKATVQTLHEMRNKRLSEQQ